MGGHYLDVAVGLSYTFLAVSLLCSATREAIASLFQTRAKVLVDAVLTLLHEPRGRPLLRGLAPSLRRLLRRDDGFGLAKLGAGSLAAAVLTHPLIAGLAPPGRMPSYIPSSFFARAFIATLAAKYGKAASAAILLDSLASEGLRRTLLAIMGEGPDDVAALENAVRIWYDTVMERSTGWYKRRSQLVLFCVGLGYACAMNIDALQLSQRLWSDAATAALMAARAGEAVSGQPPASAAADATTPLSALLDVKKDMADVRALPLPIGWPSARLRAAVGLTEQGGGAGALAKALAFALAGWIVTAFAASLGSPFWFDGVGRLLALRGSGARPEDAAAHAAAPPLPGGRSEAVRQVGDGAGAV